MVRYRALGSRVWLGTPVGGSLLLEIVRVL